MNELRAPTETRPASGVGSTSDAVRFERLAPALGALVHGLELGPELSVEAIAAIQAGLETHQVLFFRNQNLTPIQQRDFARRFGELHIHPVYPGDERVPEIMVLEYDENLRGHQNNWHTDVTFIETPPFGSVLFAEDIPPTGGDTIWASTYAAFEALSPAMQHFLSGLQAIHDFAKNFTPDRFRTYGVDDRLADTYTKHKPVRHPVVRTNRLSGRRGLFVNRSFTSHIVGLERSESDAILSFLYTHLEIPEFQMRWRWETGTVAFWDNRFTQHYALSDYFPQHRRVRRATILGDRPV